MRIKIRRILSLLIAAQCGAQAMSRGEADRLANAMQLYAMIPLSIEYSIETGLRHHTLSDKLAQCRRAYNKPALYQIVNNAVFNSGLSDEEAKAASQFYLGPVGKIYRRRHGQTQAKASRVSTHQHRLRCTRTCRVEKILFIERGPEIDRATCLADTAIHRRHAAVYCGRSGALLGRALSSSGSRH